MNEDEHLDLQVGIFQEGDTGNDQTDDCLNCGMCEDCIDRSIAASCCQMCDQGWWHGCCDDICRNSREACECSSPRSCQCNPDGEVPI